MNSLKNQLAAFLLALALLPTVTCMSQAQEGDAKTADENTTEIQRRKQAAKDKVFKAYAEFRKNAMSDKVEVREKAIDGILPAKAQLTKMFGKTKGEKLWTTIKPALDRLKSNTESIKKEFAKNGEVVSIDVNNVRDDAKQFKLEFGDNIGMLKEHVEIFDIVTRCKKGTSGSSSYVVLGDDVIFIKGFGQMLKYIAKEDK